MTDIAANIRKARKRLDKTQEWLADKLGVSQTAVALWETGKREPNFSMINKISKVLHIDISELISFDEVNSKIDTVLAQEEIIQKVGKVIDINAEELLSAYTLLNETGRFTAVERVAELVEIEKYRKNNE